MLIILFFALIVSASASAAIEGVLENPQPNTFASGIYLISGWVCDAERVEILLDGSQYIEAAYGSERLDTVPQCNDADNGFGALVNMANIGAGEHQVALIADGNVIATHDFQVPALSTGEFAKDLEGCAVSVDFPREGAETSLSWTTAMQGFQIVGERSAPINNLEGPWIAEFWQAHTWLYREGCGQQNLFMYARLEANGQVGYLRMAGVVGDAPIQIRSTDLDPVNREATLIFKSVNSIQIDFTACDGQSTTQAQHALCDLTPAGGRVVLTRVPTLLAPETSGVGN